MHAVLLRMGVFVENRLFKYTLWNLQVFLNVKDLLGLRIRCDFEGMYCPNERATILLLVTPYTQQLKNWPGC